MGSDEDKALETLRKNRNIQKPLIKKYHGKWLKEMGDGTLASFNNSSDTVRCAGEIQQAAKKENIALRIGIHEGEVVFEGGDVLGDGVNVASRLEQLADEGCINISGAIYKDIKNKAGISAKFLEEKKLKNVADPMKVYCVECEPEEDKPTTEVKSRRRSFIYILVGIALVMIIGLLTWKYVTPTRNLNLDKSIAVKPLIYFGDDPSKEHYADGVMDAIIVHLSKIEGLRVTPRTSVEQYRQTTKTASTIGKELDVSYLIDGSFLMQGNQVRLTIQLVNAVDEDHIWSEEYDRDWGDIYTVQSEVALAIAKEVEAEITPLEKEIIETVPTTSLTAYDFYIRARDEHTKYWINMDYPNSYPILEKAIRNYNLALDYDSTYAKAYAGLGLAYNDKSNRYLNMDTKFMDSVMFYCNKAMSYDDKLGDVYILQGFYYLKVKGDIDNALKEFDLAIKYDPNNYRAYYGKATRSFYNGMHGALISDIGKVSALNVKSKTTANAIKTYNKSIPEIADELGVNKFVEGAVLCLGDSICFQAKLFDKEEEVLWIHNFKVERSQILNLYNMVTKEISKKINIILTPDEENILSESRTVDNQAYDLYMKGMTYNDQMSEEALEKAFQYFKLANDIDPDWAAPYQGIASVFERQYQMGFIERSVMMPKLDAYLNKALELDPNSSWVYNLRGSKFGWFEWEWEKAEQDFLKSIELNPSHAGNHAFYASLLLILRKPDQALYHAKKAEELDPLNPFILGLCAGPFIQVGECQSALDLLKKANAIEKKHYFAYPRLIDASICIGDFQTAFEVMKEINFELWEKYELTEHFEKVFREKGWSAFLEELINISEEVWSKDEGLNEMNMASLYIRVGKYDKAMDYFEKAYKIHSPNLAYISTKPNYIKMKDNPRYIELLKKLNLPID